MLRCVIADDEPLARELTRTMLERCDDVEVTQECRNGAEAVEAIRALRPDVALLDVRMPVMSGLEVPEALSTAELPAIIFLTAFDEYAIRAFDLHAVDYLLKPVSEDRLHRAIERVRRLRGAPERTEEAGRLLGLLEELRAREHRQRRLPVKVGNRTYLQPVDEIDWIEAEGKFVRVHVGNTVLQMRDSLQNIETGLDPGMFLRVSRSAIVNVNRVREVQPWFKGDYVLILQTGAEIPSTRAYRDGVARLLHVRP